MKKNQKGFTLVEIIAVLVILGILAAVAVPKFVDLTSDAELKSVQAVKAELQSRANMYYAKYLLDKTSTLNAQDATAWAAESVGTDYTLAVDTGNIKVTPAGSSNSFKIIFTQGSATAAAKFGAVSKL